METLNQLAQNILNKLEGGRATTNSFISLEQIKYNIEHYRALFLRRELRNDEDLSFFEQPISLTFKRETKVNYPYKVNSYLVSNETLPTILRLKDRYALSIYNAERTKVIPVENSNISHLHEYNRYTKKDARAYILDRKLHIASDAIAMLITSNIKQEDFELDTKDYTYYIAKTFSIHGVFESPTEIMLLNGLSPIDIDSNPYPISMDMSARIAEGILNGTLQLIKQTTADTLHDNLP